MPNETILTRDPSIAASFFANPDVLRRETEYTRRALAKAEAELRRFDADLIAGPDSLSGGCRFARMFWETRLTIATRDRLANNVNRLARLLVERSGQQCEMERAA